MIQKERNESNEVIAAFMGYKTWKSDSGEVIAEDKEGYAGHIESFIELQFHSSWNLLIPIAKKCIDSFHDHRQDIFSALHECDIEKLFQAIVVFIKWLNDNPKEAKCWLEYNRIYWNNETNECEAAKYIDNHEEA